MVQSLKFRKLASIFVWLALSLGKIFLDLFDDLAGLLVPV
jgi:hypothetical protein